jgi:glycosyltransferase involved in cell wall biosynthesis
MNVSVLLLTYNEEINLSRCLNALTWCDDVVVVDSGSTDATVSIAKTFGARVLTRTFDNFAAQRNFGLDTADLRHDWVLHLDADEVVTDVFLATLEALVPPGGTYAYRVPSKTIFRGRWLRHAGMFPSYQVRLGHRERLRFKQVGHGQREDLPPEQLGTFSEPYLHHAFSHGMRHWLDRHVRYADDEARELRAARKTRLWTWRDIVARDRMARRRALKSLAFSLPLPLRPPLRFLYVYVFRGGFLDGHAGFIYAFMLATYEGMIAILAYGDDGSRDARGSGL